MITIRDYVVNISIFCFLLFSSQVSSEEGVISSALRAGTNDTSTPVTNAVVSVNGCTGTLITNRIVLTAGHCFSRRFTQRNPVQAVYQHSFPGCTDWQSPTTWYNFASGLTVQVLVGVNQTQPAGTFTANQYSLPGCVDIVMIRLTQPVPASLALPVAVATRSSALNSIQNAPLQMVGFGTTGLDDLIKLNLSQLSNWNRTPQDDTPPWSAYAHAHGTRGLAVVNNNLFAAGNRKLWMRPITGGNLQWQKIGDVPDIVSMTSANGALFAATKGNRLLVRSAAPINTPWRDIGHANNVTGLVSIGNRLFASTTNNDLWVRDVTVDDVDWRRIGHANDVVDLASSNGRLYGIMKSGHLWSRSASLNDVDWQYIGDIYYRGRWNHDNNLSTPRVDSRDVPRNMVATANDIYVSIKTKNGVNQNGFYPINTWPIRQIGAARFGAYPHGDGKHLMAIGNQSVRGRPGDSGGPLFWLRPGQPKVLIGVNRQTDDAGARYVVTFFNRTFTRPDTLNTGLWIETMANPVRVLN